MNLAIRIARQVDHTYRAWCPSLPGCTVYGESVDEVRGKIQDAVRGYVARLEEALPRELGRLLETGRMSASTRARAA